MEAESLFERLRDCSSGEPVGIDRWASPLTANRVASLGDMVSGTISVFPAGEGVTPGLALPKDGMDDLQLALPCSKLLKSKVRSGTESRIVPSGSNTAGTLRIRCPCREHACTAHMQIRRLRKANSRLLSYVSL